MLKNKEEKDVFKISTNIINPFNFGAYGDNIHDDYEAFNQALHSLQEGDSFYAPNATYKISSTLDLTNIPNKTHIEIKGKLKFPDNLDAIWYKSVDSDLCIQEIEGFNESIPNYNLYNSIGVLLKNINNCNITINKCKGFKNGIKIIGDGSGSLYSEIHANKLINNETALLITTSDINRGYVNENQFYIGWIEGKNGIEFKKGLAQVDKFNGNKLMFPGFEQITGFGLKMRFCKSNMIFYPRFENPLSVGKFLNYCIDEDNTCIYNMYHLHQYNISKMNFGGKLTSVYGHGLSDDGDPTAYMMQSDISYNRIWYGTENSNHPINPPDYLFIHRLDNQIPFNGYYGYIKSNNIYKKINFEIGTVSDK